MTIDHIQKNRDELLWILEHPKNIKHDDIIKYAHRIGRTLRKKRGGHQTYQMKGRRTLVVSTHPGAMDEGEVKDSVTLLLGDLDMLEAHEKARLWKVKMGGNGHAH